MSGISAGPWYLYHLRDPQKSAGFGNDGYVGITRDPARRKKQHFSALIAGRHRNAKLQTEHDASPEGMQFWIVSSGAREEVLARERLLVPKANHHLNIQQGGGPLRGMSKEDATTAASSKACEDAKPKSEGNRSTASNGVKSATSASSVAGPVLAGGESSLVAANGVRTALAGAGGAAAAVGAGLLTVGLGSAYVMGKTILKDDVDIPKDERTSRGDGRVASYVGGALGSVGTLTAIGASGSVVGLSSAGIVTGVGAIGAGIGGGVATGAVVVAALPVAMACGIGYGVYRFSKWLRS